MTKIAKKLKAKIEAQKNMEIKYRKIQKIIDKYSYAKISEKQAVEEISKIIYSRGV